MNNIEYQKVLEDANNALKQNAAEVAKDYLRQQYHFAPLAGWMNDPNGLIKFNGAYHMFYQHHPYKPEWDTMYWGHAISKDLMHWEHLPIAIAPYEPYDAAGVYSGSSIEIDNEVIIFYTGISYNEDGNMEQRQCKAKLLPDNTIEKSLGNPVIVLPPQGCSPKDFRDPKAFIHDNKKYLIVGSSVEERGALLLYTTQDWGKFVFKSILFKNDSNKDVMWECPDIVDFGEKQVLFESRITDQYMDNIYFLGEVDFESGIFHETHCGKLDYGVDYYAAQSFIDGDRHIIIAWMDMWHMDMPTKKNGWAGAMTLPREIYLNEKNQLKIKVCHEVEFLRQGCAARLSNVTLGKEGENDFSSLSGDCIELKFDFLYKSGSIFAMKFRKNEEGTEYTKLLIDTKNQQIEMNRDHSGKGILKTSNYCLEKNDGKLSLHIFVDHSSLEIFINHGDAVMTNRIYPDKNSTGIDLYSIEGNVTLQSAEAYLLAL